MKEAKAFRQTKKTMQIFVRLLTRPKTARLSFFFRYASNSSVSLDIHVQCWRLLQDSAKQSGATEHGRKGHDQRAKRRHVSYLGPISLAPIFRMINVNKKTPEVTLCLYIDSYDADTRINSLYIDVILLEYGSVPTYVFIPLIPYCFLFSLFFLIGTDLLFALDQNSVGNWVGKFADKCFRISLTVRRLESKPLAFESTFKLMNYTFDVVGSDKSLLYYKNMRNINDFFTKITNASAAENPVTLTINETQRQANADFGVQIVLRLGDEQKVGFV